MIHRDIIDHARSADLTEVGAPGHLAATLIDDDGNAHLVIVNCDVIRSEAPLFYPDCLQARHEQLGELPSDIAEQVIAAHARQRPTSGADE